MMSIRSHARLADPSDTRKVAEVRLAIGFDLAANFSRAFTQQFGYSPSNIRKQSSEDYMYPDRQTGKKPKVTFESLLQTLASLRMARSIYKMHTKDVR